MITVDIVHMPSRRLAKRFVIWEVIQRENMLGRDIQK
jgi:hypothetical protein